MEDRVKKDYKPLHEAMNQYRSASESEPMFTYFKLKYELACKEFGEDPDEYMAQAKAIERALRKGY